MLTGRLVEYMYFSLYVSHFQAYDRSAKGNVMSVSKVTNKYNLDEGDLHPEEVVTLSHSRAATHEIHWNSFIYCNKIYFIAVVSY